MKYHALYVIFEKAAKIEIVVCCILYVAFYGLILTCGFNRKRQLEYTMMRMIWKVEIDEIELQKSRTGAGSKVRACHIIIQLISSS